MKIADAADNGIAFGDLAGRANPLRGAVNVAWRSCGQRKSLAFASPYASKVP